MTGRSSAGDGRSRRWASPDFATTAGFREAAGFSSVSVKCRGTPHLAAYLLLVQNSIVAQLVRGQVEKQHGVGSIPSQRKCPPLFFLFPSWVGREETGHLGHWPLGLGLASFSFFSFAQVQPRWALATWARGGAGPPPQPAHQGLDCPSFFSFFLLCFYFSV